MAVGKLHSWKLLAKLAILSNTEGENSETSLESFQEFTAVFKRSLFSEFGHSEENH